MLDFKNLTTFVHVLGMHTEKDPIRWSGNDMIGYRCTYRGFKIVVWWWQDGQPGISINDASVEGYGYGIETLLGVIRARQKSEEEAQSPELREQYQKQKDVRAQAFADNLAALNGSVAEFLRKDMKAMRKEEGRE